HQHRLHLGRPQPLARDLDRVVRSPKHVPEPVVGIDVRPVAVHPDVGKAIPVGLDVAIAIAPEAARHARPRVADHQLADLAAHRLAVGVDDCRLRLRTRVGETPNTVTPCCATIRHSLSGAGWSGVPSYSTIVAPRASEPKMSHGPIIQPRSVNQNTVSSAPMSKPCAMSCAALTGNPPCTCSVPFGLPVVPDL